MQTQMVRTTVSFPQDFHEQLRWQSLRERKSLSRLIMEKFDLQGKEDETSAEEDLAFFRKLAKKGKQIDTTKFIRQMRDSRYGK